MRVSEQALFQQFFAKYAASRTLHPRELRAATCIRDCGTRAMGAHVLSCPTGHLEQLQFHACRHRSCPRCAHASRSSWIDAQLQRLLPCSHFHVIFTLPHELLPLWAFNRQRLAPLLMRCVRESLLALLASPRFLGVIPGLIMSLHTWGRTLSHHPHVHCLLSAGGITAEGTWKSCREGWLLPVQPLQRLFRGKLLAALWHGVQHGWVLPTESPSCSHWQSVIRRLHRKHWNIEIRPPYAHGRGVVLYLARYAKGGPLPPHRILDLHGNTLHMPYLDHRDHTSKTLTLSTDEFISRVLWHAPPRGLHTTRHAGLYSSALRLQHHGAQLQLQQQPQHQAPSWPRPRAQRTHTTAPPVLCLHCGLPMLRSRVLPKRASPTMPAHHAGEYSPPGPNAQRLNGTLHPQRGPTGRSSRHPMPEPGPEMQPLHSSASRGQAQPLAAA